jgi:hypothetical protein
MAVFLYFLLSLVFVWLFFRLWKLRWSNEGRSAGVLILQMALLGLVYDSIVIAVGSLVGEGEVLRQLNLGRYVFFTVFTPLLMITGLEFAARAGVVWAQKRVFQILIWVAAFSLVGFGGVVEWQFKDSLVVEEVWGALRYVHEVSFLPLAPILTNFVLMILGGLIWRKYRWPWVFAGALVMLVGSAIPLGMVGPWVSTGAQAVLMGCLVATERRLLTPDFTLSESELKSRFSQVAERRKKK